MARYPALMLWTDAWIADTAHLTTLERGHYFDLLVLIWRTPECRVPNDDHWLGRKLRLTADEVTSQLRPLIIEFCRSDGNWISQKRLTKEFNYVIQSHERKSASAKARWDKEKKSTPAMHPHPHHSKKDYGRKGPSWAPSGYSNGRCLGNGKASSIKDTLE